MVRIYSRTGDKGSTSLGSGTRVSKSDQRVNLYGELDELTSLLGCCVALLNKTGHKADSKLSGWLVQIQNKLFFAGTVLANPKLCVEFAAPDFDNNNFVTLEMENQIDTLEEGLPDLTFFILPGGSEAGASLFLARAVCRRIERQLVEFATAETVPESILIYVNRLSDFLFVASRSTNAIAGVDELAWNKEG